MESCRLGEIKMLYNDEDIQRSRRRLFGFASVCGVVLMLLLALYVHMILHGTWILMLVVLLCAFGFAVFVGDIFFLPALRYLRFLKEMATTIRRSQTCVIEIVCEEAEMQDGIAVRRIQTRTDDGESHILYWDEAKLDQLPPTGSRVRLECCGRHVVGGGEC